MMPNKRVNTDALRVARRLTVPFGMATHTGSQDHEKSLHKLLPGLI